MFGRLKSNYYEILGVNINASSDQIAGAIMGLALLCDPTLVTDDKKEIAATCQELLKTIEPTLSDKVERRKYNESLTSQSSSNVDATADELAAKIEAFMADRRELRETLQPVKLNFKLYVIDSCTTTLQQENNILALNEKYKFLQAIHKHPNSVRLNPSQLATLEDLITQYKNKLVLLTCFYVLMLQDQIDGLFAHLDENDADMQHLFFWNNAKTQSYNTPFQLVISLKDTENLEAAANYIINKMKSNHPNISINKISDNLFLSLDETFIMQMSTDPDLTYNEPLYPILSFTGNPDEDLINDYRNNHPYSCRNSYSDCNDDLLIKAKLEKLTIKFKRELMEYLFQRKKESTYTNPASSILFAVQNKLDINIIKPTFFSSKEEKTAAVKYAMDLLAGRDALPSKPDDPKHILLSHLQTGALGDIGRQVVQALTGEHPYLKATSRSLSERRVV